MKACRWRCWRPRRRGGPSSLPGWGVAEAVVEGRTALLTPLRDPAALAGAIRFLAADPDRRARMGVAGQALARERFTIQVHARALQDLYDRWLAEGSERRRAAA